MAEELYERIRKLEREQRLLHRRLEHVERERNVLELHKVRQETMMRRVIIELHRAREAARAASELLEQRVQVRTLKLRADNADLRRARDEALRVSQAKSDFLASMSHELRTPLNSIIGYTELIQEEVSESAAAPESLEDIGHIHQSACHLLAVINDILDLSRVEAGRVELAFEEVNLDDVVAEVCGTVAPLVFGRHNRLTSEGAQRGLTLVTDRVKLRQIFYNLVSNAAKFTERGKISVDVRWHRGAIEMSVSDTGIGIAPEFFDRLFNAYSQVDPVTGQRFGGTGLGLTLTHKFCNLLGGDISVESTPGEGTTFSVFLPHCPPKTLPVHGMSEQFLMPSLPQPDGRGAGRVLVIDDDARTHAALKTLLVSAGYSVESEFTGEQGIARAEQHPPDIVVLDVLSNERLGDSTNNAAGRGWQTLERLIATFEGTPVIVLTMLRARERAIQRGAATFLSKPCDPQTLLSTINCWIEHPGESDDDVRR